MRNGTWALFVEQNRIKQGMTRRELGEKSQIDPSYVTLMERDGYVPRRDIVDRVVEVLKADPNLGRLAAGYAPLYKTTPEQVLNALAIVSTKRMQALSAIDRERDAQDKKWGTDRRHHPAHWLAILGEEFGEACRAYHDGKQADFEAELVQVAAVAVCILEHVWAGKTVVG